MSKLSQRVLEAQTFAEDNYNLPADEFEAKARISLCYPAAAIKHYNEINQGLSDYYREQDIKFIDELDGAEFTDGC